MYLLMFSKGKKLNQVREKPCIITINLKKTKKKRLYIAGLSNVNKEYFIFKRFLLNLKFSFWSCQNIGYP